MRTVLACLLALIPVLAGGQTWAVKGEIIDQEAKPLASASVVLLYPSDSTLAYFSISGSDGKFEMRNIKSGPYLMQVSLLGYNTIYNHVTIPLQSGENAGMMVMTRKVFNINEVAIVGERIPLRIKKDTIEYDARSYKVKADAVAEDLVKKLPGIEVDRAGNIKAMGEDVENVLVDGKEFFGSDPKVATRNLPADAISKVQLYDRESDESRFTGVDDGERNPTLNFVLEEGKKSGIFGDVGAGAGTDNHAVASGKIYRFTKSSQLAGLGMYNNINQFGFSLSDYLGFSGGLSALGSGGAHIIGGNDNSFPVNFGQPVYGRGSNGAAGINFSKFDTENNRFFVSVLGNGSERKLNESTGISNYFPGGSFRTEEDRSEEKSDSAARLNFGLRKQIGSRQNLIVNGTASLSSSANPFKSVSGSYFNELRVNSLERTNSEQLSRFSGNTDASWLFRINEGKSILKLAGRASYTKNSLDSRLLSVKEIVDPYSIEQLNQFYNTGTRSASYSGTLSFTQRLTGSSFIDLSFNAGLTDESFDRKQGNTGTISFPDPELSPFFTKTEYYFRPGLSLKKSSSRSQLTLGLSANSGRYSTVLNDDHGVTRSYLYLTPRASWEFDYRTGRRLMVDYSATINSPALTQLMPVVNNLNPLSLLFGNRDLKPEYIHNSRFTWWLFDQFSFTTLLTGLNFRYSGNKIGYAREINSDLGQTIRFINTDNELNAGGDIDFSTPVKPLGIKINLSLSESFNRGSGTVNGIENINTSLMHRIGLTIDNRKKDKWDIETGAELRLTDSRYSVHNDLNNIYNDVAWFAEARYTPGVHFNFSASADITKYSARSFGEARLIPLIGAEASYYFMKNQRAVLTLAAVDILDRNTGIERRSELNYLMQRRSDIIGRYFLLSFKYRLNKVGDNAGGVNIEVKRR
jgi:hypothetical protein